MNRYKAAPLLLVLFSCTVLGQVEVGLVGGVTRNAANGAALADAHVIAHNLKLGTDHATTSDDHGIFTFTNLEPGLYEITATKNGFQESSAHVGIVARQTARVDLPLRIADNSQVSDNQPLTARERQLLERIDRLEARLAAVEAKNGEPMHASPDPTPGSGALLASMKPMAPNLPAPPARSLSSVPSQLSPQAAVAAAAPAPAAPTIPEALQAPEATTGVDNVTPFAYGDFTWLNGTPRNKDTVLDTKFFTPEIRFDTHYMTDFNQPIDHTIVGATESFRSGEVQIEQASVGGDFHWQNVRGRILFMQGLFATTTPRNDASSATGTYPGNTGGVGQWDLQNAYKYVSEAYGGYHFNVNHGLNVDAGIFVSYIGLFSYYNFDNWTYQPSYVSSNTPWFFNGVRRSVVPHEQAENRTLVYQRLAIVRQV